MAFFRRIFPLFFLIAFLLGELPLVAQDRVHVEIVRCGDTCDFMADDEEGTEFVRTNANFGEGKRAELKSISIDRYERTTAAAPLRRLLNTAQRVRRGVFKFSTSSYNGYSNYRTRRYPYNYRQHSSESGWWKRLGAIFVLVLISICILNVIIRVRSKGKKPPSSFRPWTPPAERHRETPQPRRFWDSPETPVSGLKGTLRGKTVLEKWELVEQWVNDELTKNLPAKEYEVKYNASFKLEGENCSTQIDHIVISPYGVFVIETKSWKGKITGDESGKRWIQNLSGKIYSHYSPTRQNERHINFLKRILADNGIASTRVTFISIIVFEGFADLSVESKKHIVVRRKQLAETILQYKNRVISPELKNKIIKILEQNLKN